MTTSSNKTAPELLCNIPTEYTHETIDNLYFKAMEVDIDSIAREGNRFEFYGAHSGYFKINTLCISVLEDPEDGYRSNYGACMYIENPGGFFDAPLATITIQHTSDDRRHVYDFVDVEDGHVWYTFGTESMDDYYPYCVTRYSPKIGMKLLLK